MTPKKHILVKAAEIRDATPFAARPGAVWIRPDGSIGAAGPPDQVQRTMIDAIGGDSETATVLDRRSDLILPALVNAHAHLDLTHVGPRGPKATFTEWADMIRAVRAIEPDAIRASVERGIELSRCGGVGVIGDISGAGSLVPIVTFAESGLHGVSFLEMFGHGEAHSQAIERLRSIIPPLCETVRNARNVRCGLQPHAPYSAGRPLYAAAVDIAREHNLRLSTHLAETREEIEFTAHASGPLVELLQSIGKWDPSIVATDLHPIDYLETILTAAAEIGGWVLAHVNYADDDHIQLIAKSGSKVVYCPRASAYFGHRNHRYRDMIEAGIPVALGTDSIVCLDTPDRISSFDEMRFLYRRDQTDPDLLLRMATIHGTMALGCDPALVQLDPRSRTPQPIAGLCAIRMNPHDDLDGLMQVLASDAPPELLSI